MPSGADAVDAPRVLDEVDHAILRHLQLQGRMPNKVLAQRVGLSPSACLARVRKLESEKVIEGYTAILSRRLADRPFLAWALISLGRASPSDRRALIEFLGASQIVLGVWEVAANFELLAYIGASHLDEWLELELALEQLAPNVSVKLAPVLAAPKPVDLWRR